MTDVTTLWERYISEQALYERVAKAARSQLERELRLAAVTCELQHRAKDVDQFVKKVLRKGYTDYDQVGDKAGVRVIARYYSQVDAVERAIEGSFDVVDRENKRAALNYDQLGYLGLHFDVIVSPTPLGLPPDEGGLPCEIQVQTAAQHLWADASHDLLYKQEFDPPEELQRSLYRLLALVEIFDGQLLEGRAELTNLEGFRAAAMLSDLEAVYYRYTPRGFDKELSKRLVSRLSGLYSDAEAQSFTVDLHQFARANDAKLTALYADYSDDPRANPLIFQPETLAVFERLEHDPFALREAWTAELPVNMLEGLGTIWGVAV